MRFVDGEDVRRRLIDLEPWIANSDMIEGFVFRARESATPAWDWGLSEQGRCDRRQADGKASYELINGGGPQYFATAILSDKTAIIVWLGEPSRRAPSGSPSE